MKPTKEKKEFWQQKLVNAEEQLKKDRKNLYWMTEYDECFFQLKKIWIKEHYYCY